VIAVGAQLMRGDDGNPESVVVTVTDSGIGIKPAEQEQIFEKYKQSGNKSFRGGGGTGLGLYIVKQIVEGHGGAVEVVSYPGMGTSMVLTLPIKRAA
jgi:signal transduction histidine kinase